MDIVEPKLPTQTQVDTQIDPFYSLIEEEEKEEEKEEEENQIKYWARLMSLSKEIEPYDLILSPVDSEGRQGLHRLGRSINCNITYPQKRISNIHCLLFCEQRFIYLFSSFSLLFLIFNLSLFLYQSINQSINQ